MIYDERPFYRTIECVGTLSSGGEKVDNLQIEIEYSETKPDTIRGTVIGSAEDSARIMRLSSGPDEWKLVAEDSRGGGEFRLFSDTVAVTSMAMMWNSDQKPVRPILRFELLDFRKIRTFSKSQESEPRRLLYFLDGPERPWEGAIQREISDGGEFIYQNSYLDLDLRSPLRLFVTKELFTDQDPDDSSTSLRTHVPMLGVSTDAPEAELSTDRFVERADQLLEDVLLLMSLGSKQWSVWFASQLIVPGNLIQDRVQTTSRTVSNQEPAENMVPVPPSDALDFLQTVLPRYRDFRREGCAMKTAIQTTLASREEDYVESQFLSLFTALETLKNIFAEQEGLVTLLDQDTFEEMRSDLKDVVREHIGGDENSDLRKEIYKSMFGLNRPSLQSLLNGMFEKYDTGIEDLYPQDKKSTLKDTRNNLVHGRGAPDDTSKLTNEILRLQALVNRLILRMLGWNDVSQCPPDSRKSRLKGCRA